MGQIDIAIAVDDSQTAKLDATGQKIDALGQKSQTAGQSAQTVGVGLTALGAAGVGAFGAALNSASDFEAQLSGIASVGGQDAVQQMDQIKAAALEMGARTSFSAGEAAAGMEELIKAGVPVTDVINGVADAALDLAAAGGVSVVDAASDMTQAVNVFGSSGQEVADTFAQVANASATGVNEIAAGFGNVAPVAKGFGLTMEETAEAIGVMSNAGVDGAEAGTMLKSMLLSLYTPSKQQKAAMTELGLATEDFVDSSGHLIGIPEMFGKIKSSSEKLGVPMGQVKEDMATIFGSYGITAASTFFDVQQAGFDSLEEGMANAGTAQEQAAKRLDNLKGAAEALGGSLETVGIVIGSALIGPMRTITVAVTELVNAFLTVPAPIQQAIALIGALGSVIAVGLGGAILVVPKILEFQKAIQNLGLASRAAGLAFGPLGIAMAAVGLGVLAYKTNFLGFGDAVDNVASGVKTFAANVQTAMSKGLSPFDAVMTTLRRTLRDNGFDAAAVMVGDFARAATDAVGTVFTFRDAFVAFRQQGFSPVQAAFEAAVQTFPRFTGAIEAVRSVFDRLAQTLGSVGRAFATAFATIKTGDVTGALQTLGATLGHIADGLVVDLHDWVINIGVPTLAGWIADHNPIDWIKENIGLTRDAAGGITIDVGPWTLSLPSPDILIAADQELTANILAEIHKLLTVGPEVVTAAGEMGAQIGHDLGAAISAGITQALNAALGGGGGGGGGGVGGSIDAALASGAGFGATSFSLGDAFANFDTEFTAAFTAAIGPAIDRAKAAIGDYLRDKFSDLALDFQLAINEGMEVITGSMSAGLGGTVGQSGNIFERLQQTIFDQLNALDWSSIPNPFQGASDKLTEYFNDFMSNPFGIGGAGGGGGALDVSAAGLATGNDTGAAYSTSLGQGMGAGLDAGMPAIQSSGDSLGDKIGSVFATIFGVEDAQAASAAIAPNVATAVTDGVTTGVDDGLANLSTALASGAGFGATMSGGGVGQTIADGIATSAEGADYGGLTDAVSVGISDAVAAATTTAESGDTVGRALIAAIITGLSAVASTVTTAVQDAINAAITAGDATASGAVSNGQQIISTMVAGIDNTAANVTTAVQNTIDSAVRAGDQAASNANTVGDTLINAIISGMAPIQSNVSTGVQNTVQSAIDAGTQTASGATAVGTEIVTNIGSGIDSGAANLGSALQNAVLGAIQGISALAGAAHDAGVAVGAAVAQGIADGVAANIGAVRGQIEAGLAGLSVNVPVSVNANVTQTVTEQVVGAVETATPPAEEAAYGMGAAIDTGTATGVADNAQAPIGAVTTMASDTIGAGHTTFGIGSPSKEFYAMGQMIDEGLRLGIVDGIPGVVDSMGQIVDPLNELEADLLNLAEIQGKEYAQAFGQSIINGSDWVMDASGAVVDQFGNFLAEDFTSYIVEKGGPLYTGFGEQLSGMIADGMEKGGSAAAAAGEWTGEVYTNALNDSIATGTIDINKTLVYLQQQLAAIGGEDTPKAIAEIALELQHLAGSTEISTDQLTGLAEQLRGIGGDEANYVATALDDLVQAMYRTAESAGAAGEETGTTYTNGIGLALIDGVLNVTDAAGQLIRPLNDLETSLVKEATYAGTEFVNNLIGVLSSGAELAVDATGQITDGVGNVLASDFTLIAQDMLVKGSDLVSALANGMVGATPQVVGSSVYVADAAMAPITEMAAPAYDAGVAAATNVGAGIASMADPLMSIAEAVSLGIQGEFAAMADAIRQIVNQMIADAQAGAAAASNAMKSVSSDSTKSSKDGKVKIDAKGGKSKGKDAHASGGSVKTGNVDKNADVHIDASGGKAVDKSGKGKSHQGGGGGGNHTTNIHVRDGRHMNRAVRKHHRQQRLAASR